jgi:hypothetical protein
VRQLCWRFRSGQLAGRTAESNASSNPKRQQAAALQKLSLHSYKLKAFELADDIALLIYLVTRGFPKEEMYGLTSQKKWWRPRKFWVP